MVKRINLNFKFPAIAFSPPVINIKESDVNTFDMDITEPTDHGDHTILCT